MINWLIVEVDFGREPSGLPNTVFGSRASSGSNLIDCGTTTALSIPHRLERLMVRPHKIVEELSEQKARLLDLSSDAILARDAFDRITFWNEAATEIYGFS